MAEFKFTPEQSENLKSWKNSLSSEEAKNWYAEEEKAEIQTRAILNSEEFKQGKDLTPEKLDELFSYMKHFSANRNLTNLLYKNNTIGEFNKELRNLIHGTDSFSNRVNNFFKLKSIGVQTLSQFLVSADPSKYAFVTSQTKEVTGINSEQDQAALKDAIQNFNISNKEDLLDRTLDYLRDSIIFQAIKELLGLEKYNLVNNLLWFAFDQEEEIPESEEEAPVKEVNLPIFLESINLENISKFSPHSLRNPERINIRDIISKVAKTDWVIPHFQRYFDWKKKDVQDFLESIFKDYYIGAFLLWDTSREPELDVTPIKGIDVDEEELRPEAIILDGQQRITSLYYAIKAPSFCLKKSKVQLYFYINFSSFFENNDSKELIDIRTKKFSKEECYEKLLFPVYEFENYDEWVDGLEDFLIDKIEDKERVRKIRRIIDKKLKHMWEGFEIPYISLPITMGVKQVADIFEKINTKGKLLSVFDLLIARLYKYNIELKERWDATLAEYPYVKRFYKVVEKIPIYILQAISLCYHHNSSCQREDILNIYRNIYDNPDYSFEEHWSQMSGYMNKAIEKLENLRDGFGVKDEKEIPFEPMIPVLAALLKEIDSKGNKAEYYKKLRTWYWSAIFTLSYSQAADTQMTTDFKEMKEWFEDDSKLPRTVIQMRREFSLLANKLRETQSKTSARYRGVMSLIALEGAMDFATNQTLENARSNDKDHLFPKARRAEFDASDDIDSIFNITWMSKDTNEFIKRAKKPSVYVPEFISDKYCNKEEDFLSVLKSHLINEDAYKYLKKDDFQNFLNEREKIILEKIASIVGAENVLPQPTTLISPEKPFTNKVAFYSTIKSCEDFLYWIDKYFTQAGLELLIDSLDASKVKDLRIITSNDKVDARFRDLFKDFKEELKNKGMKVELRVITDARLKAQIHDRWIITNGQCFNLPSADTLARGQYSEIKKTNNRPPFDEWWGKSKDIISEWDSIKNTIKAI